MLGLIFRTFTYTDREMFLNLYKSLIRLRVGYATSIWSPIFKKDIILTENIQRRVTGLFSGLKHLSYPERLKALGSPMLEYRRERADMIQVYKIINNIDNIDKDSLFTITKTYLYNIDPLKPHFYIVKLGFTGVYIIFLISAQKHRLWVLVRTASPRRF